MSQVIVYPDTPGNVIYAGFGRPCPKCKRVWLMCSHDLALHMEVCGGADADWSQSKFNTREQICLSEKDPQLKLAVQQQGKVCLGTYTYRLSGDGRYLIRRIAEEAML